MSECNFKPFDKVLVRDSDDNLWKLDIFSNFVDYSLAKYVCVGSWYKQCIPFEGNEHLLGTANPYVDKYVPQDGDFIAFGDLEGGRRALQIFKSFNGDGSHYAYVTLPLCLDTRDYEEKVDIDEGFEYSNINIRPATEEEKQLLLSKLHKQGKDWDAEKKVIVDYKKPYEPQDGDFVYVENSIFKYIFIKKEGAALTEKYISLNIEYGDLSDECHKCCGDEYIISIRPATEEEKQLLLSKLHEIGKDWDAENKQIVGYEKPYVPQDGHLVVSGWKRDDGREAKWLALVKGDFEKGYYDTYAGVFLKKNNELTKDVWIGEYCDAQDYTIAATEEDKKYFFNKLHEIGKDWNAEKKEIVDWKWIPNRGDVYYFPTYDNIHCSFYVSDSTWSATAVDKLRYEKGCVFKTKEDCQVMCNRLNATIKNAK